MPSRLIIIGAGPIGLAAAVGALDRGFDVTVVEKSSPGASLRRWGSTRFFSPLGMNITPRMRQVAVRDLPPDDALLTGPEMADRVLVPIAESPMLRDRIRIGHTVRAIGRRGLIRTDFPAHPLRAERPFRLLVDTGHGDEIVESEQVIDCSGSCAVALPGGAGGIAAPGEAALGQQIIHDLEAIGSRSASLAGSRILLVGHGHSAANAIAQLQQIAASAPETRVTWAVRSPNRRPCVEVAGDPLPERQRVTSHANDLAASPPPFLRVERRVMIERMTAQGSSVEVAFTNGTTALFDHIAAFTGYRPDASFLTELTVELSPVTEGGARLYGAISNITDCLTPPSVRPEDLVSGEPGFFLAGSRSYGRARTFLLQTGLQQLEVILKSLV